MRRERSGSVTARARRLLHLSRGTPLLFLLLLVIPWLFPELGIVERMVLPPVEWAEGKFKVMAAWAPGA